MRFLPRRRSVRILSIIVAAPIVCLLLLYAFLLGMQAYSAHEASRLLDRAEALRIGDSDSKFFDAMEGCQLWRKYNQISCGIVSGSERSLWFWNALGKLPVNQDEYYQLHQFMWRLGLRDWMLSIDADVKDRKISHLKVWFYGVQHEESLGVRWYLAQSSSGRRYPADSSPENQRTSFGHSYVTSLPGGENFEIYASPASSEAELRARHLNRACLLTFHGCAGFCELLPDAVPILNERKRGWGRCSKGQPRSRCDFRMKYDDCPSE